jgi:hypothetical protein
MQETICISTPRQPCKDATSTHAGGRRRKSFHQHGSDQLHPMMSLLQCAHWLRDNAIDRIRRVLLGVLKAGPVPHHVAFIMDGNRRYARNKGVKVIQGHVDGFAALRRVRAQNRLCTVYELHQKKFFLGGHKTRDRYWEYAPPLISRSFLYMPLPSTTSSAPKTRWMRL